MKLFRLLSCVAVTGVTVFIGSSAICVRSAELSDTNPSGQQAPKCGLQADGSYLPCPKPNTARVNPRGTLVVMAEAEALISVTPVKAGPRIPPQRIPADSGQVSFAHLPPGGYRVRAELAGYEAAEQEVQITARPIQPLALKLIPLIYAVTLTANVESGEVKFGALGETMLMSVLLRQGRATLPKLRAGRYRLELRPDEISWQPLTTQIEVGAGQTEFNLELVRRRCETDFHELWRSLAEWEAPAGWRVNSEKLQVAGQGIALPRAENYACYADFELSSDVKMLNGVAASFVLRAQDRQNYYLIQLTGPHADEPYTLRGLVVRQGIPPQRLNGTNTIAAFAKSLTDGFFELKIKATDNRFEVSLTDSQTGQAEPLGVLSDPNRRFRLGAVGIAVQAREQNEIGRFIIKPTSAR